jgi:hypothetical protein
MNQLKGSDGTRQAFSELCHFGTALSQRFKRKADTIHEIGMKAQRQNLVLWSEAIAIIYCGRKQSGD